MPVLKAIVRFLFSRTMLIFIGLIAFVLAVWFLGPHLGLGGARPLAETSARLMVIILTLSFLLFWFLHWPVSIVGVAAVCLMIWSGGPLIQYGQVGPLEPDWIRGLIVGLILLVFGLHLGYRAWKAVKANDALLQKLFHPSASVLDSPAKEQIKELQELFRGALGNLKGLRVGASRLRRFLQGRHYVYDLPWYMILGAPGAGKTTAILNSGLSFPLAGQLRASSLAGISGTRNCVWWFTNEAVLIDTAGRYTTHESNLTVDEAEWKGFLGLLRKHRVLAPLNGVIITVGADTLLQSGGGERIQLAATLRARLLELQEELGVRLPVYFMVSKVDLLKGFQQYFQTLSAEERAQVWGFTSPYEDSGRPRRTASELRQSYEQELGWIKANLEKSLPRQLREEYSESRRRQLYCFPAEFTSLFEPLLDLAEKIFLESHYEASRVQESLRGIYFTSALQSGHPLDSLGDLRRRLKTTVTAGPDEDELESATPPAVSSTIRTKSYFLSDLMRKVIFPEAKLVRPNRRWELRFLLARSLGHVLVAFGAIFLIGAWLNSADLNTDALATLGARVEMVEENLEFIDRENTADPRGGLGLVPVVLHQVCSLTSELGFNPASPPSSMRAGLYSLAGIHSAAEASCRRFQNKYLPPEAAGILERNLSEALTTFRKSPDDPDLMLALSEALSTYLSLFDRSRFDPGRVMAALIDDSLKRPESNFLGRYEWLIDYTLAALTRPPRVLDESLKNENLTAGSQAALEAQSRELRLYLVLKEELTRAHLNQLNDFIPAGYIDPGQKQILIRDSGRPLNQGVPGLLTYRGYHDVFVPGLDKNLRRLLADDEFITGRAAGNPGEIKKKISRLYLLEYAEAWEALINDIGAVSDPGLEAYLESLSILAGSRSPLEQLGRAISGELALSAPRAESDADQSQISRVITENIPVAKLAAIDLNAVQLVDRRFERFRLVSLGTADPKEVRTLAISDVLSPDLAELRDLFRLRLQQVRTVLSAEGNSAPPTDSADSALLDKARQLPPFFKTVIETQIQSGRTKESQMIGANLARLFDDELAYSCLKSLKSKYPFEPSAADADPLEVELLLAPGGEFDRFFEDNIKPLTVKGGRSWRYRQELPGAPDQALFTRLDDIQGLLFAKGDWTIEAELLDVVMDSRIDTLELSFGETKLNYETGGPVPRTLFTWNSASADGLIEMRLTPNRLRAEVIQAEGPWAPLRFFDQAFDLENAGGRNVYWLNFQVAGGGGMEYRVLLKFRLSSLAAPDGRRTLHSLICPRGAEET